MVNNMDFDSVNVLPFSTVYCLSLLHANARRPIYNVDRTHLKGV